MSDPLTKQLCDKKLARKNAHLRATASDSDPHSAHEAAEWVKVYDKELKTLEDAIDQGRHEAGNIDAVIRHLNEAKHQSRHRSLVITNLENAAMRLRHEIEG